MKKIRSVSESEVARPERVSPEPLADEVVTLPVLRSERVFAGKVWDIQSETFDYNGQPLLREFVKHTGAVAILPLDDDDRVLLIKQYRHPVRTRDWEIPAGLLDVPGESPLAAAQRELAEEADLTASDWRELCDYTPSAGGSNEVIRIYLARGLSATETPFERGDEEADMERRWASLDEIVAAVLDRRIRNGALSLGALAAYAARARDWQGSGRAL